MVLKGAARRASHLLHGKVKENDVRRRLDTDAIIRQFVDGSITERQALLQIMRFRRDKLKLIRLSKPKMFMSKLIGIRDFKLRDEIDLPRNLKRNNLMMNKLRELKKLVVQGELTTEEAGTQFVEFGNKHRM